MYFQYAMRTAIFAALLAVGSVASANEGSSDSKFSRDNSSQLRGANAATRAGTKQTRPDNPELNPVDSWIKLIANNKPFIIYGSIASFGILMMGLAIGSASSNPKKGPSAELELLKHEKEKAENLAKIKSEFLNQVSHELRTPLAVIIGYIECITDGLYGEIEAKHQEILQVVAKQSSHLKNMIDQILIYSRLEAGKQPVRAEDLLLTKLVGELKDTFDFLCKQKGLEMHWELPNDPMQIRSDLGRVKEVISNLLQNAIKYTDRGSVKLGIEKLATKDSIMIEVSDTGMGISEHHLANIFEPFMQVHKTSTENSRGGIGLGLSIVKKHLEQIKGTISVESELGKGTTFRVILPRSYDKPRSKADRLFGLIARRTPGTTYPSRTSNSHSDTSPHNAANTHHAVG
jgi:signal transduction histidine kinase